MQVSTPSKEGSRERLETFHFSSRGARQRGAQETKRQLERSGVQVAILYASSMLQPAVSRADTLFAFAAGREGRSTPEEQPRGAGASQSASTPSTREEARQERKEREDISAKEESKEEQTSRTNEAQEQDECGKELKESTSENRREEQGGSSAQSQPRRRLGWGEGLVAFEKAKTVPSDSTAQQSPTDTQATEDSSKKPMDEERCEEELRSAKTTPTDRSKGRAQREGKTEKEKGGSASGSESGQSTRDKKREVDSAIESSATTEVQPLPTTDVRKQGVEAAESSAMDHSAETRSSRGSEDSTEQPTTMRDRERPRRDESPRASRAGDRDREGWDEPERDSERRSEQWWQPESNRSSAMGGKASIVSPPQQSSSPNRRGRTPIWTPGADSNRRDSAYPDSPVKRRRCSSLTACRVFPSIAI
jgi:hypothetical protein